MAVLDFYINTVTNHIGLIVFAVIVAMIGLELLTMAFGRIVDFFERRTLMEDYGWSETDIETFDYTEGEKKIMNRRRSRL